MQKVTTFLWFQKDAEAAARFYVSLFDDSEIVSANPMSVTFRLAGVDYIALNGGETYKLNEAVSLFIRCDTQTEVDRFWNALIANGGSEGRCGWLEDRWGLSWQVIPEALGRYLSDPDRKAADRTMQAMMAMKKIDIAQLHAAFAG